MNARQILSRLLAVAAISTAAAIPARAQIIAGTAIDTLTFQPIQGVTISIRPLAVANTAPARGRGRAAPPARGGRGATDVPETPDNLATATDKDGRFAMKLPDPGSYQILAMHVGHQPVSVIVRDVKDGERRSVTIWFERAPTIIDTMVTRDRTHLLGLTPGQFWFARHMAMGKGLFFSGVEITDSGANPCDFFAALPKLKLYRVQVRGMRGIGCGGYLDGGGTLSSAEGLPCLGGRIDHNRTLRSIGNGFLLDSAGVRVAMDKVIGVEVYRNRGELPHDDMDPPMPMGGRGGRGGATSVRGFDPEPMNNCVWLQIWTSTGW